MRRFFIRVAALLVWPFAAGAQLTPENYPFRDPQLPLEERVEDLIGRMTIEEKIDLLSSYRNWFLHPCERLGIPAFQMADGPLGLASWGEFGRATAYPASLTVAASWNPELAGRLGAMFAREFRARGIHFLLAPGVNNYRASRGARNFEYLGEDPLSGRTTGRPLYPGRPAGGASSPRSNISWATTRSSTVIGSAPKSRNGRCVKFTSLPFGPPCRRPGSRP